VTSGYLRLLRLFVRQDLDQRFSGNVVGIAWAAIAPVLQLALFTLVFAHIFKARVPGLDGNGYVAFIALGMWPWFAFAEAVGRSNGAIVEQAGLLDKVAVPASVLVFARVLSAFTLHGAGFALVLAALAVLGVDLQWHLLPVAIVGWIPLLALALAMGSIVAITQVFIRDLIQVMGYLLSAWMFLSPILYPRSLAPAAMEPWHAINPIAGIVESIRDPLLFGSTPGPALLHATTATLVVGGLAWVLHRRLRRHLQDFL
jgi:lipopolysaccharide transport system permease protein